MQSTRQAYEANGYCFAGQLASPESVAAANPVFDRIVAGDYETGVAPPHNSWGSPEPPTHLVKVDQPQMADRAVTDFMVSTGIGAFAAELTGASMVQVWAVQLIHKPTALRGAEAGAAPGVGWHQDEDYWNAWWEGEVFTCWVALSDVTVDAGPMCFVPGSHEWGFLCSGNFFDADLDRVRDGFPVPEGQTWSEVPAVLSPGDASFHHRRTVHGSGANHEPWARRGLAVHLRTDRSKLLADAPEPYVAQLTDPRISPVLFGG